MRTNIDYLRAADLRIQGLRIHNPNSSEYKRMTEVVRPDILSKMTVEEIDEYNRPAPEPKKKRYVV